MVTQRVSMPSCNDTDYNNNYKKIDRLKNICCYIIVYK